MYLTKRDWRDCAPASFLFDIFGSLYPFGYAEASAVYWIHFCLIKYPMEWRAGVDGKSRDRF